MLRIDEPTFQALGYDLDREIRRYKKDIEDHKLTVGVPAPLTYSLVEQIVKRHNGQYEIVRGTPYVRIVDGVIMDKRKFYDTPSVDWTPVTSDDMVVGAEWDEDENAYVKRRRAEPKRQEKDRLLEDRLTALETNISALTDAVSALSEMFSNWTSLESTIRRREELVAAREAAIPANLGREMAP